MRIGSYDFLCEKNTRFYSVTHYPPVNPQLVYFITGPNDRFDFYSKVEFKTRTQREPAGLKKSFPKTT